MTIDDFWMRLCALSADLEPASHRAWNETSDCLIAEFRKFPVTTREAVRSQVGELIERLQQLYARLN